jgi:hypothetical protein
MTTKEPIEQALRETSIEGVLPCAKAFELASSRAESPRDVGAAATAEGLRIIRCQLGLFGYREFGSKGMIAVASEVPEALAAEIRAAQVDDALPCAAAWRLAEANGLPRMALAAAADALKVRISDCQLGCF